MEYTCKYCNKSYSSYQSRCNHIRRYHKDENSPEITQISPDTPKDITQNITQISPELFPCRKCGNNYKYFQGRWRHEQKCKGALNKTKDEEILEIKKEFEDKNKKVEKENMEIKKEMENLKTMLQKALKIHPKTLNKINNQLNNHGTINNITIIQLGSENLSKVLNDKQKRFILDRQAMSLNHLVDLIHVSGKYKKFQNVYITNLQSTFAYRFDEKLNKFIAVNKNELLTDIVDSRMYDIQKFYAEIYPELEPKKAEQIKKFIDRMGNEEDELKDIKKEEIKLILYNNREKILIKEEDVILIKDNKNIDMN
jgi:hypothetical protein